MPSPSTRASWELWPRSACESAPLHSSSSAQALRSIETFLKRTRDAASSGAEVQGGKLREAEREMERAQRSAENAKKVRTLARSEIPALTDKAGADREGGLS